jgi:glycosyltransferase involved in cell wall biosynthesis
MTSWILDISSFNQGMDVICLTSKNEGTPVSLIEAQAGSIPVISTDVGGVSDIIQNDISGFVVKKGDFATYLEKLRLLVEDEELRNEFAKSGTQFIHEKFHYSRLVHDMENYYNELIAQIGINK